MFHRKTQSAKRVIVYSKFKAGPDSLRDDLRRAGPWQSSFPRQGRTKQNYGYRSTRRAAGIRVPIVPPQDPAESYVIPRDPSGRMTEGGEKQ
jgi:hypothetical protein